MGQRLRKKHRLGSKKTISRIFREGELLSNGVIKLKYLPNELGYFRFVISISKRVGTSPARNRIKRLIREAIRLTIPNGISYDFLFYVTYPPSKKVNISYIKILLENFNRKLTA